MSSAWAASDGDISVYFGKGVTQQEQVIFANYIHAHLEGTCENALRLRLFRPTACRKPAQGKRVRRVRAVSPFTRERAPPWVFG